jgi:hypothetical protein
MILWLPAERDKFLNYEKTANDTMQNVSQEKKEIVMNLYVCGIGEEFIAMQLDLEIPLVISILKELNVYKGTDMTGE